MNSAKGHEATAQRMVIDGKQPINVFFLDNGSKLLLVDNDTTAEQLCQDVAMSLGWNLDDKDYGKYFALYESLDGDMINRVIGGGECIVQVQENCAKIIYMMKLFMDRALALEDPVPLRLMFVQAHHNIITGHYYCEPSVYLQLAGLLMYDKFGPYNPSKHKVGFIPSGRLAEFIPATVIHEKRPQQWENDIYQAHSNIQTSNAKLDYLQICKRLDGFGNEFFEAQQFCLLDFPAKILLGISSKGIRLLEVSTRKNLELFKLAEIFRWGFKPGSNFYFEVKGEGGARGPVYEFTTPDGNKISELLTDYANALLEELGILRGNKPKPPPPPSAPGASKDGLEAGGDMDESEAATKMQAAFRGFKLRTDLEKDIAAINIQALWRGYQERVRFDQMIEALEQQLEAEEAEE